MQLNGILFTFKKKRRESHTHRKQKTVCKNAKEKRKRGCHWVIRGQYDYAVVINQAKWRWGPKHRRATHLFYFSQTAPSTSFEASHLLMRLRRHALDVNSTTAYRSDQFFSRQTLKVTPPPSLHCERS